MTFTDQAAPSQTSDQAGRFQSGIKPLVIGANGRIGLLLQRYWGRNAAVWHSRAQHIADPDPRFVQFDPLKNPDALSQAAQPQGQAPRQILCLAGPVPGRLPARMPARGTDNNMQDHVRLGLACVAAAGVGARVFLASSAAVYGAPSQDAPLHENTPLAPQSPYGHAKSEMEAQAIALGHQRGVKVTVLRIGNIAGFDAILGGWRPDFTLDQFANGDTPKRSYIGVQTLADVLAHLMQEPDLPAVLNIAQPSPVAMGALLQAAARPYRCKAAGPSAIANVTLDVTRLAGFVPLKPATPEDLVQDWHRYCAQIRNTPQTEISL